MAYAQPLPDFARKALVEATVVDAATRAPLAGAWILVVNEIDLEDHVLSTNSRGVARFVYAYADSPRLNSLEVRKEGYVPQRWGWGFDEDKDNSPRSVTIAMRRGMDIGGLVVDEQGRPIKDVTVVATVLEYGPGDRLKDASHDESLYEVPFLTDAEGRWSTGSCPPTARKIGLQLIHPDYVSGNCATLGGEGCRYPLLEALRGRTDRQVMVKGVRVGGRVVDVAGGPVAGAKISDSSQGMTFLTYARHTESDEDGRFHLHLSPGSKLPLTVQKAGYAPITRTVVATPGLDPIEFRLEPGKTVRGRVVGLGGKPIPGACVCLSIISPLKGVFLRTWTGLDGRFRWDGAPAGKVDLSISKEGTIGTDYAAFTADDPEKMVVLRPGTRVTITARDSQTGKAVEPFLVRIGRLDPVTGAFVADQAQSRILEGEYWATLDATAGPYRFEVSSEGYETITTDPLRGDEKAPKLVVQLKKKATRP